MLIPSQGLPISLLALINDTVGALIASSYHDPETIIGAIFGTGCNAAYMEECSKIPKLQHQLKATHQSMSEDAIMAINCEYGAFDNSHSVLPRTKYDKQIDDTSPRPGEQAFEKMSAGLYLGEIFRLVVCDLTNQGIFFESDSGKQAGGKSKCKLDEPYALDTETLSKVENDDSSELKDTKAVLQTLTGTELTTKEALFLQHVAHLVANRGARLCACGISAICLRKGVKTGHVAADGSIANKHPHFKQRWEAAVREILDLGNSEDGIKLTSAEDGSGVGAAVIVALTLGKAKMGRT
jgi:hexokinase